MLPAAPFRRISWLRTTTSPALCTASKMAALSLTRVVDIPEKLRQLVAWVSHGREIAELALERGIPIRTCNIKKKTPRGRQARR